MTGYGMGSARQGNYEITAEIKTLNSKFADVTVRIPAQYSSLELIIRKKLTQILMRGKMSANIEISSKVEDTATLFDDELLAKFYQQFKASARELNSESTDIFTLALHAPGVLKNGEDSIATDLNEAINDALDMAIEACDQFRVQEGNDLQEKLSGYINAIKELLAKVDLYDKQRIEKIEERMKLGLTKNKGNIEIDDNRFEQELIYYIEKLDINEEKVRLANHLKYFIEVMADNQANGKKLGFIAQEIGREINTIGSKANNAEIQRIVVEMKEELEKIKEQSLNVL